MPDASFNGIHIMFGPRELLRRRTPDAFEAQNDTGTRWFRVHSPKKNGVTALPDTKQPTDFTWFQKFKFSMAGYSAAWLLKLVFGTCRTTVINPQVQQHYLDQGRPCLGVTWHRAALYATYYFGVYKPAMMVSRSRDGEYLARFMAACGCLPVRGSSSRGGAQALVEMIHLLRDDPRPAATVADGPRGPRYLAKPGMVLLASRTGRPLLPMMWSTNRAWVFSKAWDRQMLPKPLAHIHLAYGEPILVPPKLDDAGLEEYRLIMERELNRITAQVDELCGHRDP